MTKRLRRKEKQDAASQQQGTVGINHLSGRLFLIGPRLATGALLSRDSASDHHRPDAIRDASGHGRGYTKALCELRQKI